ncbi:uncharacterized protein LOC106532336 [Austrofundulus limnaeus]|uniref:Uncharacterized protein LOC106532336 n=1 Tax=Austrofundulus limnaeus TaxID=52670 RepID=A0A2I4CV13_AUSLI|nr:PREDICTED: uncharacterized protein LOC106532336 [Austrofundulus limnaeus]
MHSVAVDGSGSPRKRAFSRGLSEDESLRSIITETESSSRRLTRSESRTGTLRRRTDSQSEQDLLMGLPEMLELQASYDEVVQELRGLEVERETLLFQVDVLQDTLEGVEELLAEAQREAGKASLELEQERDARRKLESLVSSLLQEVERIKEEKNNKPPASVDATDDATRGEAMNHVASAVIKGADREEKDSSPCGNNSKEQEVSARGGPDEEGILTKLRRMVNQPLIPSLALDNPVSTDGVLRRPYKTDAEEGRDLSPDRNDSDKSAYEDASAETPEQEKMFPGDGELPHDSDSKENGEANSESQESRNPEGCVLS